MKRLMLRLIRGLQYHYGNLNKLFIGKSINIIDSEEENYIRVTSAPKSQPSKSEIKIQKQRQDTADTIRMRLKSFDRDEYLANLQPLVACRVEARDEEIQFTLHLLEKIQAECDFSPNKERLNSLNQDHFHQIFVYLKQLRHNHSVHDALLINLINEIEMIISPYIKNADPICLIEKTETDTLQEDLAALNQQATKDNRLDPLKIKQALKNMHNIITYIRKHDDLNVQLKSTPSYTQSNVLLFQSKLPQYFFSMTQELNTYGNAIRIFEVNGLRVMTPLNAFNSVTKPKLETILNTKLTKNTLNKHITLNQLTQLYQLFHLGETQATPDQPTTQLSITL